MAILIEGKLTKADTPNLNGHIYPKEIMQKAVADLQEKISQRRLLGCLGARTQAKTRLTEVSHMITGLKFDEDRLVADIEVLDTEQGRLLEQMLTAKMNLTIHSTWLGCLEGNKVEPGAKIVCLDIMPYDEATGG